MSTTRDAAYVESQPRHPTQCERVLAFIRDARSFGMTRKEIETASGFPVNIVTGRVNDLLKRGAVVKHGERTGEHGVAVEVLVAKEFAAHPVTQAMATLAEKRATTEQQMNLF